MPESQASSLSSKAKGAFLIAPHSLRWRIENFCLDILAYKSEKPADFWHLPLFASFWIYIALFPIGYGWREVLPPVSLIFLVIYYRYAWGKSVLKRLRVWWLFVFAAVTVVIGVVFSIHPVSSFLHACMGLNKAYILPLIGMECARDAKCLRRLAWACAFACFWQGMDGLWQSFSGFDFIMGYPINGIRLTGSLGDYTVGNYIALALVPAFGIWPFLKNKLGALSASFIFLAIFWPAFFLLQGASSRSGALAVAGALGLWILARYGWRNLFVVILPSLALALFAFLQPGRLNPDAIAGDNRWDLWGLAWKIFLEHPWLGAGAGQYNAAFREMGLAPARETITISHPHDLYLDILYAHGIIGFACAMIFLLGFLLWGYRHIKLRLIEECARQSAPIYWRVAIWFWLGYAAWLLNGIFGHDFYRIWWLAQAMTSMGIMIGAVVNGVYKQPGMTNSPAPPAKG